MLSRNERLIDLVWSPFKEDEFIAYGSDLWIFKVKNSHLNEKSIKLNEELYAELVVNYAENSNPKQVSWYCGKDNKNLYAISLSNHKIQLISYNSEKSTKSLEIFKEFSFKQIRQCTHLAWNPNQKNLLAGGFDKIRNEHSILVWDVRGNLAMPTAQFDFNTESIINCVSFNHNKFSYSSMMIGSNTILADNKQTSFRALYETGNMDTCNSLAWNPSNENHLFVTVNGKLLKMFDIKSSKAVLSVNSKYVQGISVDNNNQYQLASYLDNHAVVWDTRMFNAPVHKIDESEQIGKIQWCPTKSGQLGVLVKSRMNFYNIQQRSSEENDDKAPVQIIVDKITRQLSNGSEVLSDQRKFNRTNSISPNPQLQLQHNSLSNFCWFNFNTNKLLIASNQSILNLKTLRLYDKIVLTWSPNGDFYWSSKLSNISYIENLENDFNYLKELKERTKLNYGLKYYILNVINGNATTVPPVNSFDTNATSVNGYQATPLALTLNSQIGLGYLFRSNFVNNYQICDRDNSSCSKQLKELWNWFENVNGFFEKTMPINPKNTSIEISHFCRSTLGELYSTRYCGLMILLNDLDQTIKKNEPYDKEKNKIERFKALAYNLCGWEMKDGCLSNNFFASLKHSGKYERACCLALLTDNYEQGLEILESAIQIDPQFGSLWIALRYFIDDQKLEASRGDSGDQTSSCSLNESLSTSNSFVSNTTASQTSNKKSPFFSIDSSDSSVTARSKCGFLAESLKECSKFVKNFTDPYLRAMFNFMINQEKAKDDILFDREILFQDRVALSIYFNFDPKNLIRLQIYFDKLENECIEYSDLRGILLTGLSPKCLDLFQSFIDSTNDLQSVCLAVIHSPYLEVIDSSLVNYWISCYREQLNRFKMWEKRAEYDLLKMKLKKYQTLTISPDYGRINQAESEPNIPSSSSSTSSLNSITKTGHTGQLRSNSHSYHQIHNANSRVQSNQVNFSLSSINLRPNAARMATSQSMNFQVSLSANPSVSLNCNSCGKNIMKNTFKIGSNNASNNFNSLPNTSLNVCLNCYKLLPQCVVCLRLMKVNLTPSPLISQSQSSINRVQTTPKMFHSNNHSKKMSIQYKSPSQLDMSGLNGKQFFLDEHKEHESLNLQENKKDRNAHMNKVDILFTNNFYVLKSTKFGNWFSWCMSCHHGGHIKHLINWFRYNKKCPYLHCNCQCTSLDQIFD